MSLINQSSRGESCKICGETEKTGYHLNTVTCEACRKFFLRNIDDEIYRRFICNASKNCVITKQTRANCQYCRFQKCLQVGMSKEEKFNKEKINYKELPCTVCCSSASGLHYGVISCEGCKQFFKRQICLIKSNRVNSDFKCMNNGACEINFLTSVNCKACRFNKCQKVGMNLQNIKIGRQSNLYKQKLISTIENKSNQQSTTTLSLTEISVNNLDSYNSNSSCSSIYDLKSFQYSNSYNEKKKLFDNFHGYEAVFEFFFSKAIQVSNNLVANSNFQKFSLNDQRKLLYHAIYSLTALELTKSINFTNLFECDSSKYQEIVDNFQSFGSSKFISCLTSLFNNVKDINLDNREYELYSSILILSNAACVENESLLLELNTQTTKELIDYMKSRRKEYDSSNQLIKLSGDIEIINLFIQHILYEKFTQFSLTGFVSNLNKYSEMMNYNRWMQHD